METFFCFTKFGQHQCPSVRWSWWSICSKRKKIICEIKKKQGKKQWHNGISGAQATSSGSDFQIRLPKIFRWQMVAYVNICVSVFNVQCEFDSATNHSFEIIQNRFSFQFSFYLIDKYWIWFSATTYNRITNAQWFKSNVTAWMAKAYIQCMHLIFTDPHDITLNKRLIYPI